MTFLSENYGTIIVCVVLAAVVAGIVAKMVRDKRRGKCIGGCSGCAQSSNCGESGGCCGDK